MAPINGQTTEVGTISYFGDSPLVRQIPPCNLCQVFSACLAQKWERKIYESDFSNCLVVGSLQSAHHELTAHRQPANRCFRLPVVPID